MNKIAQLQQRLTHIGNSLATEPGALALLALGSASEQNRMDQYSDLDFFVIVADNYQTVFLKNLDWLQKRYPLTYYFKNTADGYKALYKDGIFCEFAVFELAQLHQANYSRGTIIWKHEDVPMSIANPKHAPPALNHDHEFLVGELLTNILVGLGRYIRGEKTSAAFFIQHYALNRLIQLIISLQTNSSTPCSTRQFDLWSLERRIESHHPRQAQFIHQCLSGIDNLTTTARLMLEWLEEHFEINQGIKKEIEMLMADAITPAQ